MLERRAGEDNFKRLLQRLLAVSHNSAATPGETQSLLAFHVISLDEAICLVCAPFQPISLLKVLAQSALAGSATSRVILCAVT